MALQLEVTSGRTLTLRGIKKVSRVVQRVNSTTRSYNLKFIRLSGRKITGSFVRARWGTYEIQRRDCKTQKSQRLLESLGMDGKRNCKTVDDRSLSTYGAI